MWYWFLCSLLIDYLWIKSIAKYLYLFDFSHFEFWLHILVEMIINMEIKYIVRSIFIPIPKKENTKECSNYHTVALISHASKAMLKIQVRFQQYMNWEFPYEQAVFRKSRRTTDHTANIHWIMEKTRELQKKKSTSASLTMLKPLTVWTTTNCGKFFKWWEYQTTLLVSWETRTQVKT